MNEDFIQFVWQFMRFDASGLKTDDGQSIRVLSQGRLNTDSGPDFSSGRIFIDDIEWIGNVEIHTVASDWDAHNHQHDSAYNNVILHVVYENDRSVFDQTGRKIPTIELKNRIDPYAIHVWQKLSNSKHQVACKDELKTLDEIVIQQTLNRNLIQRLERKTNEIEHACHKSNNDWEYVLHSILFRAFGFRVNSLPFSILSNALSFRMIESTRHNQFQLEALLFGQAGFLEDEFEDDYPAMLRKEFLHLKNKFQLKPLSKSIWKMSRMRPNNFPVLRIAQLAAILANVPKLYRQVIETDGYDELKSIFSDHPPHAYWQNHSSFDKNTTARSATLGRVSINTLMINSIAPFVFYYGRVHNREELCDLALNLLYDIPPEKNGIIRTWSELGVEAKNAADSQALIQLKNENCSRKNCVSCAIGTKLLMAS